jgi:arylsulfatase
MKPTPTIRALALSGPSQLAQPFAQQITGTPGSPSSTTTIDGKYLPNPPVPFGGTINMDAQESNSAFHATGLPFCAAV